VRLDGKPLGRGSVKREVPAGRHQLEVRYGQASATESFVMEPAGTYTYEVTPTSPAPAP
jgi:hypothetical protein